MLAIDAIEKVPMLPDYDVVVVGAGNAALFAIIGGLVIVRSKLPPLLAASLFALAGLAFRTGTTLPVMYAVWAAGLAVMYPMVAAYARFKAAKPATSVWRML